MQCLEDPRVVGIHYDWHLSPAPPPQDVLWLNIHISKNQRRIRAVAFNSLLIVVSIILSQLPKKISCLNIFFFSFLCHVDKCAVAIGRECRESVQRSRFFKVCFQFLSALYIHSFIHNCFSSAIVAVRLSVTGWGAPLILFIINSLCLPIMVQWVADSVG